MSNKKNNFLLEMGYRIRVRMVKTVTLWNDKIEIEYNFTGTDGDGGKSHRVVSEFSKNQGGAERTVRTEPTQPHQCRAVRTKNMEIDISITFFGFTARAELPIK